MDTSLLATRLRVPTQPHRSVHRAALVDALEQGIPRHKLTLLSAPAGYGKTTLLSQWASESQYPVAWLSLREEDNDPERFLGYLLKAWEMIQPDIGERPPAWLARSMFPDAGAVRSEIINLANELSEHVVVVMDDYHLVSNESIHETVTFLLDNLPPSLHFVLSTRTDPPLPVARYRARRELLEIRVEDLRFQIDESAEFLAGVMNLELSNDQVVSLHDQLEGWAAGLQLAALSLERPWEQGETLSIGGRHRYVADYLAEDVLQRLPEDVRLFLLQTSILDHLSGELCDRVTGRNDGSAMLERLERENLFLVPLDDRREWFRYHRIFGDFLRERLRQRHPELRPALHRRAASWYLQHDSPDEAFAHAIEGDDVEAVVEICDRYGNARLLGGEFRVVQQWLDAIPDEWYAIYPVFGLLRAGLLGFHGDLQGCIRCIDDIESRLADERSAHAGWQLARVRAVQCFVACMRNDIPEAERYASQALESLSERDLGFRPGIFAALGDVYRQNGRWADAYESYRRVLEFMDAPVVQVQAAHVYGALADLDLRRGRLRDAAGYWRKALAALEDGRRPSRLPLPVIGWIHIRMAEILYEWNDLVEAERYLVSGLERVELGGDTRSMIAGYVLAGRLALAAGDPTSAAEYRDRAMPLVEGSAFHDWTSRFERFQLELWLAQDHLRTAVNWADEMLASDAVHSRPDSVTAQLAMARVLIVRGDSSSVDRADAFLDQLLEGARAEGRTGVEIEALALQSLASWRRGDRANALASLERSLTLAESEGYIRLFADLGLPMARLLQEAKARDVIPEYVGKLLNAFGADGATPTAGEDRLPELLTEREHEVLQLLAVGLTNNEISGKLFISPETVKKHTGNIYGKLGVRSRTQAVARARSLELLT